MRISDEECLYDSGLTDLIKHSKYFDDLEFRTILQNQNSKLSILGLNCQSINAKFDKLKMFIDYVNDQCPISVICIQNLGATK